MKMPIRIKHLAYNMTRYSTVKCMHILFKSVGTIIIRITIIS